MEGTTLSNLVGGTLNGNWQIPSIGTTGTIQNTATGLCLSANANTDTGSVVVEEALNSTDAGQQWKRSVNDGAGFFYLSNPKSGLSLTMLTANTLTIGIVLCCYNCPNLLLRKFSLR